MVKKRFSVAEVETFYTNMFSYFVKHHMTREYYFPEEDDYTDSVIGLLTKDIYDTLNKDVDMKENNGAEESNIGEYVVFNRHYRDVLLFVKDRDRFMKVYESDPAMEMGLIGFGIYDFMTYDTLSDWVFSTMDECFHTNGLGIAEAWIDWKHLVILAELNGKPLPSDFKKER